MKILLLILSVVVATFAANPLEEYNIDPDAISVSGISSGAAFASQFHVAHSQTVMGAAVVAGIPYWCSWGNFLRTATCMATPDIVSVGILTNQAEVYSSTLMIDHVNHLLGDKVYVLHGTEDDTVQMGSSHNIEEFYQEFGADVATNLNIYLGHGYPTFDDGVSCPLTESPYINNCGFHGAYEMLNHIYSGELTPPVGAEWNGQLLEYDQEEFVAWRLSHSFDDFGYVYVPQACAAGEVCRLHVAFHGCSQGKEFIGTDFVARSGYLEVADLNNIVVLFPQIKADWLKGNLYGCWDWWAYEYNVVGFLDINFATKLGLQVDPVKSMLDRVAGL